MMGVDGVLCGIRPGVAQTIIALGLDLGSLPTMRTLREALKLCIAYRSGSRAKYERVSSRG
jgi:rsbT co-antagonist protein RsbR